MNETVLAITRKVVLCVGMLAAAMLFAYPHWRLAIGSERGTPTYDQDAGRAFILSPPAMAAQVFNTASMGGIRAVLRINYTRQIIEVAVALMLTFGLMRALRPRLPTEG